jgi:hypothetical protein
LETIRDRDSGKIWERLTVQGRTIRVARAAEDAAALALVCHFLTLPQ